MRGRLVQYSTPTDDEKRGVCSRTLLINTLQVQRLVALRLFEAHTIVSSRAHVNDVPEYISIYAYIVCIYLYGHRT